MDPVNQVNQVCISGLPDIIYTVGTGLVTIAASSIVANFAPNSGFGKVIHWLALNFSVGKKA